MRKEIADGLKNKAIWAKYHFKNLPQSHVSLAQNLPDRFIKKESSQLLKKDQWEAAYKILAKMITRGDQVVGKPEMEL